MLSRLDKLVVSRFSRTRGERRRLVRMARNIRRTLDAGEQYAYVRLRGLRLNVAQVLIASLRRKPTLVLAAMGAVVLYGVAILYFVLKHFAGHS